jgi:hypothetical protein
LSQSPYRVGLSVIEEKEKFEEENFESQSPYRVGLSVIANFIAFSGIPKRLKNLKLA